VQYMMPSAIDDAMSSLINDLQTEANTAAAAALSSFHAPCTLSVVLCTKLN